MKYRIGVDLGTSSIGMAVYSLDDNKRIKKLEYIDSYIFGEPINPKDYTTSNTKRRSARLIRRQIERKAKRLKKIAYLANYIGVTKELVKSIPDDKVHCLRAKATSERISLHELIKVLFHIVKNRGYKGDLNREEQGVGKKIKETSKLLQEHHVQTLGQLLYLKKQEALQTKEPWRKLNEGGIFIKREMVEDEFNLIWQEQEKHHDILKKEYPLFLQIFPEFEGQKSISLKEAFYSALFYQRPIYWNLDTVGNCDLEQGEKRAARSQIAFQEYRLAIHLLNLRIYHKITKKERSLTNEERIKLYKYLGDCFVDYQTSGIVSYKKVYEFLQLSVDEKFSVDRRSSEDEDKGIKGNSTLKSFYAVGQAEAFKKLDDKTQEIVLEFLSNITKYSDIQDNPDSYIEKRMKDLTKDITEKTKEHEQKAFKFIKQLKEAEVFFKKEFKLEKNRSSYSIKALKKLTKGLLEGNDEQLLIKQLYPQQKQALRTQLRDLEEVKTNSPIIDRVLREFKREIDFIIKKFGGNPDEIIIELSRDLKNSLKMRSFIEQEQKKNESNRKKAMDELHLYGIPLTNRNIERYLLWQEQDKKCPYSGQAMSQHHAFDEVSTQVDHIIPQAFGGRNVFSNKVLAFTEYNRDKGDRTPFVSSKTNLSYCVNASALEHMISLLQMKANLIKKRPVGQQFIKPIEKRNLEEKIKNLSIEVSMDELEHSFSERQHQDTAWIGKIVLDWCKDICPNVTPSFGALTAHIRRIWKFDSVLPLVRILENKPLENKEGMEIKSDEWQELFMQSKLSFKDAQALKGRFEIYVSKLSNKPKTETDWQQCFDVFYEQERQQNIFNKRLDHRHHAVDAAVIGLCSRVLVEKASLYHAKYGSLKYIDEKNGQQQGFNPFLIDLFSFKKECVETLKHYLFNYVVWHKPDRFPSGQLFDETAYNMVEKDHIKRIVKVCSIGDFEKTSLKETKKEIEERILGESIKIEIIKQLENRVDQGLSLKEALLGRNKEDGIFYRGNKVKKIRAMYKKKSLIQFKDSIDKAIVIPNKDGQQRNKYFLSNGYACMDFDEKTGERKDIIPLWKYALIKNKPIPQGVIRIFAQDMLFEIKTKNFFKVKSFRDRDGLCLILHSETQGKELLKSNIKDLILVSDRQKLAEIKRQYGQ